MSVYKFQRVDYKIIKGLNVEAKYQFEKQTVVTNNTADVNSYSTSDLINRFSQIDPMTGLINYVVPYGGILRQSNAELNTQSFRTQLNFNHHWGFHSLSAIAGAEIRAVKNQSINNTVYGYNADPLSTGNVDYRNQYPNYIFGNDESLTMFQRIEATFILCLKCSFLSSSQKSFKNLFHSQEELSYLA